MTIENLTFADTTVANANWTTAVDVVEIAAGQNALITTIHLADTVGNGGEFRLVLTNGTKTVQVAAVTIEGHDSLDLSPGKPLALAAGWTLQYQSKGGAGIDVVITGVVRSNA